MVQRPAREAQNRQVLEKQRLNSTDTEAPNCIHRPTPSSRPIFLQEYARPSTGDPQNDAIIIVAADTGHAGKTPQDAP